MDMFTICEYEYCLRGMVMISKKSTAGLSYLEIVIAFALLMVVVAAVFPTISQAARNMEYAQSHYVAHRNASSIMLAVRDAVADGDNVHHAALNLVDSFGVESFSVWISGDSLTEISSDCAPQANIQLTPSSPYVTTIIIAIWNEHGYLAGHAIGAAIP